jgi:hypothetical protein
MGESFQYVDWLAIFVLYYNMVKVFFWTNTENFLLLTQMGILSKFCISLSKMCTSSPKKIFTSHFIFIKSVCIDHFSNVTQFNFPVEGHIRQVQNFIFTSILQCCNAGECDWLFHWQHKLWATFSANVNINYRFSIKVYYRICTLRHIRIERNHGSQNVFWVLICMYRPFF